MLPNSRRNGLNILVDGKENFHGTEMVPFTKTVPYYDKVKDNKYRRLSEKTTFEILDDKAQDITAVLFFIYSLTVRL